MLKGSIINDLLNGVLVSAGETSTLLRPRHRVIAMEVARRIAPMGVKYEAILSLLKQLSSSIVPNDVKRRAPAFLAYRGLINSDGLFTLFGGDRDTILGLYQELEPFYRDQFLFWLHYAMAFIAQGDLDIGETYLNQANAICDNVGADPFQIKHQLAILYLSKAIRLTPPTMAVDLADAGIALLEELIQSRGDKDAYPYSAYLTYVTRWYVHAGRLVTEVQWRALQQRAKEAERRYPLEDTIREGRKRVDDGYLLRLLPESQSPEA